MICGMDSVAGKSEFTRGEPASVISDGVGLERLAVERENEILFITLYRLDLDANKIAASLRPEKNVGSNDGGPAAETIG